MPGTMLDSGDTEVKKTARFLALLRSLQRMSGLKNLEMSDS